MVRRYIREAELYRDNALAAPSAFPPGPCNRARPKATADSSMPIQMAFKMRAN
jgi:hypothetical protein